MTNRALSAPSASSKGSSGPRWLLYALGGGLGHVQRSLCLARAAAEHNVRVTIVANTGLLYAVPPPSASPWIPDSLSFHRLPQDVSPATARERLQELLSQSWDALVVDTFPRGLGGELLELLPAFLGKKVWTHRDIAPDYVERFRVREAASLYDLRFSPGDAGELTDMCQRTAPWVLASAEELPSREAVRRTMGVADQQRWIAVIAAGRVAEQAMFRDAADSLRHRFPQARVEWCSLHGSRSAEGRAATAGGTWPLLELLPGVDLVVGAGGYNTVYETASLGVPCVGLAQPRMYDRQVRRLSLANHCRLAEAPAGNRDREWADAAWEWGRASQGQSMKMEDPSTATTDKGRANVQRYGAQRNGAQRNGARCAAHAIMHWEG